MKWIEALSVHMKWCS